MKPLTKSLKDIGFLTIALTLALAANFAYGQWSNPPGTAPGGNIAAPINESGDPQIKSGDLGVWDLTSNSLNTNNVRAVAGVRSSQYCDVDGLNCLTHAQIVNVVNNTTAPAAGPSSCAATSKSAGNCSYSFPSTIHGEIAIDQDTGGGWGGTLTVQCNDGTLQVLSNTCGRN